MTTPPQDDAQPSSPLLGPMADVDAGPGGPAVGAFFDLDGTLVAGYTAAAQTKDRLRRGEVGAAEFVRMM